MKTLFFAFACFLLGLTQCPASDQMQWRPMTAKDFPAKAAPPISTTLVNLEKYLSVGASMSQIVATCGLPTATSGPAGGSIGEGPFTISGGIVYHNGVLAGEESYLRFRYDLPGTDKVYITTDKDQHVQYARLESMGHPFRKLVGDSAPIRIPPPTP